MSKAGEARPVSARSREIARDLLSLYKREGEESLGTARILLAVAFAVASVVGAGNAAAQPCTTVAQGVAACPDAEAARAFAQAHGQPLSVDPWSLDRALDWHSRVVRSWAHDTRLTPLLFPGSPAGPAPEVADRPCARRKRRRLCPELPAGTLFPTSHAQARAFYHRLRLRDLTSARELRVRRGDAVWRVRRKGGTYRWVDGPWAGMRATVFPFDRLEPAEGNAGPPAAWDLDAVRVRAGVRRFDLVDVSDAWARVHAVFASDDTTRREAFVYWDATRTAIVFAASVADLRALRDASLPVVRFERAVLAAAATMVREGLWFDEPKHEVGQQDGELRKAWWKAYRRHRDHYQFNGVRYRVFDRRGRPMPPQVCIDFIIDAFDRSAGSWYRPRGEPRGRTRGFFSLRELPGYYLRSVWDVLRLTRKHPEMWERHDVPPSQRIPWKRRRAFHRQLAQWPWPFHEADVLVIWGLRSDGRNHFHTFLVYRTDPLTGQPVLFADQAGRAAIRPIDVIMRSAPRRAIRHHLRLRASWWLAQREHFEAATRAP